MIWTVFPIGKNESEMPQDFSSYELAEEYASDNFEEYIIESTGGECV